MENRLVDARLRSTGLISLIAALCERPGLRVRTAAHTDGGNVNTT